MYLLLVNPKAGNNHYSQVERSFKSLLEHHKIKYKIVVIDDLNNIKEILDKNIKSSTQAIIAVGGNGTTTDILDALTNYELPFGVIPMSRNNHLANILKIKDWQTGVKVLANHKITEQRLGKIGKRYFIGSLMVAPKRNLLANIFTQQSWLKKFIGNNLSSSLKPNSSVATEFKINSNFEIQCQLNNATIHLDNEAKRMTIIINTITNMKQLEKSIFKAERVEITSSLNMPIVSGNETVANTPAVIQITNKTIPIIQPK